jgi:hypothetical protein
LNEILNRNNQFLSIENYKNLKLSVSRNKILRDNCLELQQASIEYILNLKPENIENYQKIKNDLVECEAKYKMI